MDSGHDGKSQLVKPTMKILLVGLWIPRKLGH
jgi:hypothetical protein